MDWTQFVVCAVIAEIAFLMGDQLGGRLRTVGWHLAERGTRVLRIVLTQYYWVFYWSPELRIKSPCWSSFWNYKPKTLTMKLHECKQTVWKWREKNSSKLINWSSVTEPATRRPYQVEAYRVEAYPLDIIQLNQPDSWKELGFHVPNSKPFEICTLTVNSASGVAL